MLIFYCQLMPSYIEDHKFIAVNLALEKCKQWLKGSELVIRISNISSHPKRPNSSQARWSLFFHNSILFCHIVQNPKTPSMFHPATQSSICQGNGSTLHLLCLPTPQTPIRHSLGQGSTVLGTILECTLWLYWHHTHRLLLGFPPSEQWSV